MEEISEDNKNVFIDEDVYDEDEHSSEDAGGPELNSSSKIPRKESEWLVTLSNPTKNGEGYKQYVTYTITVKAPFRHPNFEKTEYSFVRRYSDFEWLRNKLAVNYRARIIPSIPEKAMIKKFDDGFVQARQKDLEKFLRRVLNNKVFLGSQDVKNFIELNESRFSALKEVKDGSNGIFTSLSKKITKVKEFVGVSFEVDEWYDQQKEYLLTIEEHYQTLVNKSRTITIKEKDGSHVWKDMGETARILATEESLHDKTLSKYFDKMSEVTSQISVLDREIYDRQKEDFEDILNDQVQFLIPVKQILTERDMDLYLYQTASNSKESKLEKMNKSPDDMKLKDELRLAETKETETRQQFEKTSDIVREELERYFEIRNEEIRESFHNLVQDRMNFHLTCADTWKGMLKTLNE